jgi:hypothetical protein
VSVVTVVAMRLDPASARRIADGGHVPLGAAAAPDLSAVAMDDLDDVTIAYVLAARAPFDALRRSSAQLAGLLLLAAIGSREGQDLPMLDLAVAAHAEATEALRGLTPPPRGAHHHRHLLLAASTLGGALAAAKCRLASDGDVVARLNNEAIAHLRWASGALPGFEMVAVSQGCCAAHAPAQIETTTMPTRHAWRAS